MPWFAAILAMFAAHGWPHHWHPRLHHRQRQPKPAPMQSAVASWYNDAGQTASGFHSYYGVAVCGSGGGPCVPFGTRILFCFRGRCITAVADDHGPYVPGRWFDLNQNTTGELGFSGVQTVAYRIGG